VNVLKRMGQPLRRNIVQAGNKGEARNCKTPTEAQNLIFADSILQKVLLHTDEEIAGEWLHISVRCHIVARRQCMNKEHLLVCCM
jgi:hypothetical protein